MSVVMYEPQLAAPGGFFSYVFHCLVQAEGGVATERSRPLAKLQQPREHVSAWLEVDGVPVLLDMSDHVFLIDVEALKHCGVYLKSNLHRPTLRKVLAEAGCPELEAKVKPFFSFAGYLQRYLESSWTRDLYARWRGNTEEVCDVVGVYEHLRREGESSVFEGEEMELTPSRVHYWARVHTLEALREAGLTGTLQLTSRYQRDLEDGELIRKNLSQSAYRRAILRAQLLMINTLPHALLPWKASEAIALGRPFVVDVPPLMEQAEPFALQEGVHYLSLLPPASFSETEPGRVLHRFTLEQFQHGAEQIRTVVRDGERMQEMREAVRAFRDHAFSAETVTSYLRRCVESAS